MYKVLVESDPEYRKPIRDGYKFNRMLVGTSILRFLSVFDYFLNKKEDWINYSILE